jgi:hypothetical protein
VTGHDLRAGPVFLAAMLFFSLADIFDAALAGRQAG